jgi:hypothetical protein
MKGFGGKYPLKVEVKGIYFENLITPKVLFNQKKTLQLLKIYMYLGQYTKI